MRDGDLDDCQHNFFLISALIYDMFVLFSIKEEEKEMGGIIVRRQA